MKPLMFTSHDQLNVASFEGLVSMFPIIPSIGGVLSFVEAIAAMVGSSVNVAVVEAIVVKAIAPGGGGWKEILTQLGVQSKQVFTNPTISLVASTLIAWATHFLMMPAPAVTGVPLAAEAATDA